MSNNEMIVMKQGSSSSENSGGIGLDQTKIDFHVQQHVNLRNEGIDTVDVASGAVVAGKEQVLEFGRQVEDFDDNELALLGTSRQISHWEQAARPHGLMIGQVLGTHRQIDDSAEGRQIVERIGKVTRKRGVLVVLNENNAAASEEMKEYEESEAAKQQGEEDAEADNDWLAAHLAIALGASTLLLLSNIDGFKIGHKVTREIKVYDVADMLAHCKGTSSSGTGGMRSKLRAAERAARAGINVIIGNASIDCRRLLIGDAGTRIVQ